jgi:hypothetical protein
MFDRDIQERIAVAIEAIAAALYVERNDTNISVATLLDCIDDTFREVASGYVSDVPDNRGVP